MTGTPISRRSALALAAGALALRRNSAEAEIISAEIGKPIRIDDIAPGGWRQFDLDGLPVFVRRLNADQMRKRKGNPWVVVSGICTHAGCQVVPGLGSFRGFACFCHGSEYDASGAVRRGPAKENLPEIPHVVAEGTMTFLSAEPPRSSKQ